MTIASKIRMLAILATVIFASALYALSPDPLRPQAVENIGAFCHTGTVTTVCQNRNFVLEKKDGSLHFHFVQQPFEISHGDIIEASGDLIRHFKRDRPGSSGTDYHFTPAAPSPGA